jgi:Ca-activated chloride channel family protein
MQIKVVLPLVLLVSVALAGYAIRARAVPIQVTIEPAAADRIDPGAIRQGELIILDKGGNPAGLCPLEKTDVKASISGFLSRVTVTQDFANPGADKIEAVYTFPLPPTAAVDDMTMAIGERTIKGKILRREEARAVYDAARKAGHVASLLDQERPNIFTQSVANIEPGAHVRIIISYVEVLEYEDGKYQFVFPMVVGPRYIPGTPMGKTGGGFSPDTTAVPDASRITPNVTPPGTRAGHDISIQVDLDAGVPITYVKSTLHEIDVNQKSNASAHIELRTKKTLPNRDFILSYGVAGGKIEDAILTHARDGNGYFTLILQPPAKPEAADVTPKELVFVLDTSGSMSGFPIEKAKECIDLALGGLNPHDTFNLITFAGDTHILFPEPVAATRDNLDKARAFLAGRTGGGGTEMMKAIRAALDPSDALDHIRVVCFMTDGYVGNDMEIISEVQKHPNARVFSFGVGNSVNRFLLDSMAREGRGEVEYVTLQDDGSAAARRFHERVHTPLLTDVSVDFGALNVSEVFPARIPDVFSSTPVVVCGRYTGGGRGTIRLSGEQAGRHVVRELAVDLPAHAPEHDVLATLWARQKIDDVMNQDWAGVQTGTPRPDVQEIITRIGLEYRLITQYTSFVAVEEMYVTEGGQARRMDVPVEMPEGVSYEGVFGESKDEARLAGVSGLVLASPAPVAAKPVARAAGRGAGAASKHKVATEQEATNRLQSNADAPVDKNAQDLTSKLSAELRQCLAAHKAGQPISATFVTDGKALVRVFFDGVTPNLLEHLKRLGFELVLEPKSGTAVIGRIPVSQLEALATQPGVRYVAAQMN